MPASFGTEPASSSKRSLTFTIAASVGLGALVVLPAAEMPLGQNAAFLPAIGTATALFYLVGSYIFLAQFRFLRCVPFAVLSAGFLYAGLISAVQMLVFPGILFPQGLGKGFETATWLWLFWHAGFALFMLGYAASEVWLTADKVDGLTELYLRLAIGAAVPALVALLACVAILDGPFLPDIAEGRNYQELSDSLLGKGLLVLTMAAFGAVIVATHGRTLVHLGMIVAVLANLIDVVLLLGATDRFALGWYFGRVCAAVCAGFVPVLFLLEMNGLYARAMALNSALENLALIDALTGLPNRRQFNQRLSAEWSSATRRGTSLALMMIDVDFFKKYNDRYGHPAGDAALRRVAQAINAGVKRSSDLAARYGGEEFAVILPDTDLVAAVQLAEAIRRAVARTAIPHEDSPSGVVTVSVGVAAVVPKPSYDPSILTEAADRALYAAKERGRDRVISGTVAVPFRVLRPGESSGA